MIHSEIIFLFFILIFFIRKQLSAKVFRFLEYLRNLHTENYKGSFFESYLNNKNFFLSYDQLYSFIRVVSLCGSIIFAVKIFILR